MYTQCPECLTFFHLKPSHLKAANGRVRCSRCKHVFNALETLRDELTPEDIATVDEGRKRESKRDAPTLNEEYAGDLFDGLEYTSNAELRLDGAGTDAPPEVEREVAAGALSTPARELPDVFAPRPRRRHPALLALANVVLVVLLAVQLTHWQRFALAEHAVIGPWLERAYAALGMGLEWPRDLRALKVSRSEVSSHPEHPRALHLTALVENTGDNPQPWPHLHVELQDRWGETIAARYFTRDEYLRDPSDSGQLVQPHARHAIELAILDPGSAAVGFQVEPCFARGEGHVCAGDIDMNE